MTTTQIPLPDRGVISFKPNLDRVHPKDMSREWGTLELRFSAGRIVHLDLWPDHTHAFHSNSSCRPNLLRVGQIIAIGVLADSAVVQLERFDDRGTPPQDREVAL